MTKKQIAALVATALTALAGLLTQCPDDAPQSAPIPVMVDGGH
jgi:hypothetical protein